MRLALIFLLLAAVPGAPRSLSAVEQVVFERGDSNVRTEGEILLEDKSGGMVLHTKANQIFIIEADKVVARQSNDEEFELYSDAEMEQAVLATLPRDFQVHRTVNYTVYHDTSDTYAQWCGSLFERLNAAFTNYWSRRGITTTKPERRLTAIVFADRRDYLTFSRPVLGEAAEGIIAYFNLETNQLVMYDLTQRAVNGVSSGRSSFAEINRILSDPLAAAQVATVIHEATHQVAFNRGIQQRLSDCPLWFTEGIATYFETPDLRSTRGWSGIGEVNRARLRDFGRYLRRRPGNSLQTLVIDDKRFHETTSMPDAYAEAWALTYFLLKRYPRQYASYVKTLSQKRPGVVDPPEQRWEEFLDAFGKDAAVLDREFILYYVNPR